MIRQCLHNENIYGMFMLPGHQDVGNSTMNPLYENAYSSLKALDFYSKADTHTATNYQCILPSGTDISSLSAPFKNVQFFTQDFSDATASLVDLQQLVQSVGFNLVLRMLNLSNTQAPFQDLINARLVDYTSHVSDGIFTTIGLNVFQYPETLLEEFLTIQLEEKILLMRWSDTQNFISAQNTLQTIPSVANSLKIDANRFVQEQLEQIVDKSMGQQMLGSSTFYEALESEILKVMAHNYQGILENYLFALFNAMPNTATPNFYAAIVGQELTLRNELVVAIHNKIQEVSTVYQNIEIVKLWLQYMAQSLEGVLKNWGQRYHLSGDANGWNAAWKKLYHDRLTGRWIYKTMACTKAWYREALTGVATLCYYNAFVKPITQVIDAILCRNNQAPIATNEGIALPSIRDCEERMRKVQMLLNTQDNRSLTNRKDNIAGQLSNVVNNSQINFLFNGNDYVTDVKQAMGSYNNQGKFLSFATITNESLWQFLNQEVLAIKSQLIAQGVAFIQTLSLFAKTDVVQIMQNVAKTPTHPLYNKIVHLLTAIPDTIRADVPAMVSLDNQTQFQSHNNLKLIVASALADNNVGGIVSAMQSYQPSVANSNYVQLSDMKNTVVVYQEYGYLGAVQGTPLAFNPLLHLSYQDQVRHAIQMKIDNQQFDESVRLAYMTAQELMNTQTIKIK